MKKKLREFGMDPMERLYYERMEYRKKAYSAKQQKGICNNQADRHNRFFTGAICVYYGMNYWMEHFVHHRTALYRMWYGAVFLAKSNSAVLLISDRW